MNTGIYAITAPSGGQYIGSALNFGARWRNHRHQLKTGKHHNLGLRRACAKYGLENLTFSKLLVCRREDLIFFEQRAIDVLRPRYNACPTAGSQLGIRHSDEAKRKNANAHRGTKTNYLETKASPEEIKALIADYKSGLGARGLYKKYKAHWTIVARVLKANGVRIVGKGDQTVKRCATHYAKIGKKLPAQEIALRQATRERNFLAQFGDDLIRQMREDHAAGVSIRSLHKRHGITRDTIKMLISRDIMVNP